MEKELPPIDNEKDYARLIAAQNESERRIKIKSINDTLSETNKKKKLFAITSGICFSGMMVALLTSGVDPAEAIKTEIAGLSSFDSLVEYLKTFTPAMIGSLIAFATSLTAYIKADKEYKKADKEFYNMTDNEPVYYQDVVERQARNK